PPDPRQRGLPCRGLDEAAQHLDRRGLARPVRAQQPVDLAMAHRERQVADRGEVPVLLDEAVGADRDRPALAWGCPTAAERRGGAWPPGRAGGAPSVSWGAGAPRRRLVSGTAATSSAARIRRAPSSASGVSTSSRSPKRWTSRRPWDPSKAPSTLRRFELRTS